MPIQKIALMGQPVLRRAAQPVSEFGDQELERLIENMKDTMREAPGVGLAAPQLFVGRRVIVFRIPADRGGEEIPETALINPEIEPLDDRISIGWEGCLSLPRLRGLVPRFKNIVYRGALADGTRVEATASGFLARVIQHEVDHLDGILYIERMHDLRLLSFDSEAADFRYEDYYESDDDA